MMNHSECLEYIQAHGDEARLNYCQANSMLEFENIGNSYGNLTLSFEGSTYIACVECSASWRGCEEIPDYLGDALVNWHKQNKQEKHNQ